MSKNITIEKGIEIPAKKGGGGRGFQYPVDKMETGDSFLIETDKPKNFAARVTTWNKAFAGERRFVSRTVEGGVRVWRVE